MNKFLSTQYSESAFNIGMLALRLTFGILLCVDHGFHKLMYFNAAMADMINPFHIGKRWALILCIFAEVFCSLLLSLGLFTRVAALILVINMAAAAFIAHKGDTLAVHEPAFLYLSVFAAILLVGPGRISVDGAMGK